MTISNPPADELVQAVQTFLTDTVAPQVDKHTAFHIKVACHVLNIIKRELSQAASLDQLAGREITKLLDAEQEADVPLETLNDMLCKKIQDGEISFDDPQLLNALKVVTAAKLAIDNPSYGG